MDETVFKMENLSHFTNDSSMNNKLEFLSRRNQGRQLMAEYIESLSQITGIETKVLFGNILELSKTDFIYDNFIINIKSVVANSYTGQCTRFSVEKSKESITKIEKVAKSIIKPAELYLMTKLSRFCGAIRIDSEVIISNISKIITYDEDSCNLVAPDLSIGVMIDCYSEVGNSEFYDFIAYYL